MSLTKRIDMLSVRASKLSDAKVQFDIIAHLVVAELLYNERIASNHTGVSDIEEHMSRAEELLELHGGQNAK